MDDLVAELESALEIADVMTAKPGPLLPTTLGPASAWASWRSAMADKAARLSGDRPPR